MHRTWNGTMKLCNVAVYLAQEAELPIGSFEIKFKWPHQGKIRTITPEELTQHTLRELRLLWEP